jgi:5-methylcytosine-specific restriction endonuclease McrA
MTGAEILLNLVIGATGSLIAAVIYEYARNHYPSFKRKFLLLFPRAANSCLYCGAPATHLDHIVPFSLGGNTSLSNFRFLCAQCNFKKI